MIRQLAALLLSVATSGHVVAHLDDSRITESSSLVDLGRVMVTANDSGHDPVLFVVDGRTGSTVGTTRFAATATDTESMAPAGRHAVWVGDTGDNLAERPDIAVFRVPVRTGDRVLDTPAYRLAYPDGPHDAEALFTGRGGRLYVVTKAFFGGAVYAAPRHLSSNGVNRLRKVAPAPPIVTDAASFGDRRHVILRSYGRAFVFALPSFRKVGSFDLPRQRQGESISVGPGDRIRIGTEGARSAVLQVALPARIRERMHPPPPTPAPSPSPSSTPQHGAPGHAAGTDWLGWVVGGALLAGLLGWTMRRRTLQR